MPYQISKLKKRLDEIADAKAGLDREQKQIEASILGAMKDDLDAELAKKAEPFGTVNMTGADLPFDINVPKKIDWDQEKLAALHAEIASSGSNPAEYIEVSYSVPESKYKAWPHHIALQFQPARTVTPGKPKISFKKEAA